MILIYLEGLKVVLKQYTTQGEGHNLNGAGSSAKYAMSIPESYDALLLFLDILIYIYTPL